MTSHQYSVHLLSADLAKHFFFAFDPQQWLTDHLPISLLVVVLCLGLLAKLVGAVGHLKKLFAWIHEKILTRLWKLIPGWLKQGIIQQAKSLSEQLLEQPVFSTAVCTLAIRVTVILGFAFQHSLRLLSHRHVLEEENLLWNDSPWNVAIFIAIGACCLTMVLFSVIKSFVVAKIIDKPGATHEERLEGRHKLFKVALLDVLTIFIAGLWPASIVAEVHLGYFVAAAAAWQFHGKKQVLLLFGAILLALLGRWAIVGWLHEGLLLQYISGTDYSSKYPWVNVLLLNVAPKLGFWAFLGILCLIFLQTRVASEERMKNESIFRALAEALPFEVFVKNMQGRYDYASEKMLHRLRTIPGNEFLGCARVPDHSINCIHGKSDLELKIDPVLAESFGAADKKILENGEKKYQGFEPDFLLKAEDLVGEYPEVWTTKVPLLDRNGICIGLVGYCDEAENVRNAKVYEAIMKCSPHYFFEKNRDSKFTWANSLFWRSAGISDPRARGAVYDKDLYPKHADDYRKVDLELMKRAEEVTSHEDKLKVDYENEEQHQFKGKREERVKVFKKPIFDKEMNVVGVQGCFYEVQGSVARRAMMERAIRDIFPELYREILAALGPIVAAQEDSEDRNSQDIELEAEFREGKQAIQPGPTRQRYLRFLFNYLENLTRAVRLINLSQLQIDRMEHDMPELAWKSADFFDPKTVKTLGETLMRWPRHARFEFKLRIPDGQEKDVKTAKVDNGWVYVICGVFWINAAKAIAENDGTEKRVKGQPREAIILDLRMKGKALCIAVTNNRGGIGEEITHPRDLSCPWIKGGQTMGIGLEIVCRIAEISGGDVSCEKTPGEDGAIFSFECPVAGRTSRKLNLPWQGDR